MNEKILNVFFASFDVENGPMNMSYLKMYYQVPYKKYFPDGINYTTERKVVKCDVGLFSGEPEEVGKLIYELKNVLSPGSRSMKEGLFDKMLANEAFCSETPCRFVFDSNDKLKKIMNIVDDDLSIDFSKYIIYD